MTYFFLGVEIGTCALRRGGSRCSCSGTVDIQLLKSRPHEHRSLAHTTLRLAEDIHSGNRVRDSLVLHLGGVLETCIADGSLLLGVRCGVLIPELFLLLELFRVSPEEHVHHHIPRLASGQLTTEVRDLTSQEPVHQRNGLQTLVVAGDGDIDVIEGRVGVAEADDRDIGIRGFLNGSGVSPGVGHNNANGVDAMLCFN